MREAVGPVTLTRRAIRRTMWRMGAQEHAIMAGESLYGKRHAVLVPVYRGRVLMPRRAKPTLCSMRRVMVTGEEFNPDHPESCSLCAALYPREG